MSEEQPSTPRRRVSPEGLARRAERQLVMPFRGQIAELQSRVAFIAGSAISSKATDRADIEDKYGEVRAEICALLEQIDRSVTGQGLGPADDCRRALQMLLQRLL